MYSICNQDSKYSVNPIYEGYSCKNGAIVQAIAPHKKGGHSKPPFANDESSPAAV